MLGYGESVMAESVMEVDNSRDAIPNGFNLGGLAWL